MALLRICQIEIVATKMSPSKIVERCIADDDANGGNSLFFEVFVHLDIIADHLRVRLDDRQLEMK